MELSQFKGAAEIGAIVRHVSTTLTTGERLLPADGSLVNPAIYPKLNAALKTNVRPIARSGTVGLPLQNSPNVFTRSPFPVADLSANYVLCSGSVGASFAGQELTAGSFTTFGSETAFYCGQPSFSQDRQKKVIPMTDGNGLLTARITTSGQPLGSFNTPRTVSATSQAGPNSCPSLMRKDGSLAYIFASDASNSLNLRAWSNTLAAPSTAWTALPLVSPGGDMKLAGTAVGNSNLSIMLLAGASGFILKSTNNATSWQKINLEPSLSSPPAVLGLCGTPNALTGVCRLEGMNDLFITSDAWTTFRKIPLPILGDNMEWITLAQAGIEEGTSNIFAMYRVAMVASSSARISYFVIRTTDHGLTWSDPILFNDPIGTPYANNPLLIPNGAAYMLATLDSGSGTFNQISLSTGKILPVVPDHKVVADRP